MEIRKCIPIHWLFVLLFLVVLRPERALADGLNCLTGACVDGPYSYNIFFDSVTVDGPNGVETFSPLISPLLTLLVNDEGGFVFAAQDFVEGAGQYTSPADGYPNQPYPNSDGGYLQLGPPPPAAYVQFVCPTCTNLIGSTQETHTRVTGLSDTGVISGLEVFGYDDSAGAGDQFFVDVPAYWGLSGGAPVSAQLPLPEPSSLLLFGTGLLLLGVIARKKLA
jgi:hypothetical protein